MLFNYPLLYTEHLSRRDLELLAGAGEVEESILRARLAENPFVVDEFLASPRLYESIFEGDRADLDPGVTPFLVFGTLVNRSLRDLRSAAYVEEWSGPGQRLPVFDVEPLREFLEDGSRRFFLIELLASFTRVASGSVLVRTRRGYRRRRFSELDPVRLAEVVDHLPVLERPGGYRRLGDVALFLSGVFPDHTARHPLAPMEREWLTRSAAIEASYAHGEVNELWFLEAAGAGWYRRAVETATSTVGSGPDVLGNIAQRFAQARRILNYLTDRYLYRVESGLSGPAA